jgi:hypothetical protein
MIAGEMDAALTDRERLHAIESLAQRLYEESEPGATPWVQRGRSVREAWIAAARRILAAPKPE